MPTKPPIATADKPTPESLAAAVAEPTPAPAEILPEGQIALIWDPTRDPSVAPSVGTATPIRPWGFIWVSQYAQQRDGRAIPQFDEIVLRLVGRNWVDAAKWAKAKQVSKEMSNDPIGRALRLRMIVEFVPIVETLTGTLADYSLEDAQFLIQGIWDADILRAEQKAEQRPQLVNFIAKRITELESGDVR